MILCGGRGTRLGSRTLPKPLVAVGGRPIVEHVVGLYAAQGLRRFVLAVGWQGDVVTAAAADLRVDADVDVRCVDTGEDTETGERVLRLRETLDGEPFHLTYADGLADVDLAALEADHVASGRTATVTVVRPELPFGVVDLTGDDRVTGFREKPRSEHWVNGGFIRLEPDVFDVLEPGVALEREPLAALADAGRLGAHRHEGFWRCMDTQKDALHLNDLWDAGDPPWRGAAERAGAR